MPVGRRTVCVAGLAVGAGLAAAPLALLRYPRRDAGRHAAWRYLTEVLALALERAGGHYALAESATDRVQARVIRDMLTPGGEVDVMWSMTDLARENQLIPLRIPLDFGLIGVRLALVREPDRHRWRDVQALSQIATQVAGQGHDWPDVAILRSNGLPVSTSSRYETLFDMLRLGRIDYFPRSIIEIDAEAESSLAQGLVIEPHLALRYPAATYLFVRPDKPQLAADLLRGLEAAVADGSLLRLFTAHHGPLMERHQLQRRRVLELRNPLLPPLTPLQRKELWLNDRP